MPEDILTGLDVDNKKVYVVVYPYAGTMMNAKAVQGSDLLPWVTNGRISAGAFIYEVSRVFKVVEERTMTIETVPDRPRSSK
jgi:hypothetical protein